MRRSLPLASLILGVLALSVSADDGRPIGVKIGYVQYFNNSGRAVRLVSSSKWGVIDATMKRDETIRGHVFCSFLALLLKRALEQRLEAKGQTWEWEEVVRGLDNLQEVEARFQGKRFVLRSQVLGQAHKALMAAGVALPPTLREKA